MKHLVHVSKVAVETVRIAKGSGATGAVARPSRVNELLHFCLEVDARIVGEQTGRATQADVAYLAWQPLARDSPGNFLHRFGASEICENNFNVSLDLNPTC